MIGLEELYALVAENEQKKAELEAENRVLDKLINIEKSKSEEQQSEEVVEEPVQQDESY
jgi:hypothetical protein